MPSPVDLQAVIQTVAQAAFSLILLLIPVLIKLFYPAARDWLLAKALLAERNMTEKELSIIKYASAWAVSTVEQLRKTGVIPDNKEAAERAGRIAQQWLQSRGILLDMTELSAAIEAAVHELPSATLPSAEPKALADLPAGSKWE